MNTEKELQEKLDWLEENHYFKVEEEYRLLGGIEYECRYTSNHVIHFETVLNAPLGVLKASHNRWLRKTREDLLPQDKEVIVELIDRETYNHVFGREVYIKAEVTVKQAGVELYTVRGEFKFENQPHGDMKYYKEVIRGSFL